MSFFSKTQIKELKNNNERIIRIAVSNVPINPTIAITTSNKIHLYNESGQKHQYELTRAITPTCIEWHPFNPILVIGWDNGRITIWNQDTKAPKQQTKPHFDPIMMIRFNQNGSRMISSDLTGTIGIWQGINILAVYQKEWAITHCVFSDLAIDGIKSNLGTLFLFAGRSGTVCLANDLNMCSDVCRVTGTIKALMFYQKQGSAIVITSNLLLVQFKINISQKSVPQKKVKLSISGEPQNLNCIWIGQSLLSTSSNQNMIRFWHLQADQNYSLTVYDIVAPQEEDLTLGSDKISSIVYDARGRSLVAATRQGRVMFWKNMALGTDSPIDKDQWASQPYLRLGKQIQLLAVGKNNSVIVCKQSDNQVVIVSETKVTAKISGNYRALLKSSEYIEIVYQDKKQKLIEQYNTKTNIKGIDLFQDRLLYWNNKNIEILQFKNTGKLNVNKISNINIKPLQCLFINRDSFIISNDYGFTQMSFNGNIKETYNFSQNQGKVLGFDLVGNTLVMWTQASYIRIFNIGAQIKAVGQSRRFQGSKGLLGNIRACSINADGKKVGIISNKIQTNSGLNCCFHIYDTAIEKFVQYQVGSQRIPIKFFWDKKQPRYFGIQVQCMRATIEKGQGKSNENDATDLQSQEEQNTQQSNNEFQTYFYTTQTGVNYQDKYSMKNQILDIFALKVPYFYTIQRKKHQYNIKKIILHDFQNINYQDNIIKSSILNFSFYLTAGNLDQAYKSVKNIQHPSIWQKMAIMCVKCKRIDVAEICIGNMKFARGARSIRQSKKQPQIDTQLAMVAIQLGMIQQAKNLYEDSKRFDLLAKICQANAEVDKAVEISDKYDRINLKNSYYNAAKFYQASNKLNLAIQLYQKSNTHIKQVPRMLLEHKKINQLQQYILTKRESKLLSWLGNYKESIGQLNQAIKYYQQSSSSNLVRLYLAQNKVQQSIAICSADAQPQACFLLARHLQKNNQFSQAIHFYSKAQYYTQAIKIAINHKLDGQIMEIAMNSPSEVAMRAAAYFQKKKLMQKAIILYKKAGNYKKSNALAIEFGFVGHVVKQIPAQQQQQDDDDLLRNANKQQIQQKVKQLLQSQKYNRVVPLLIGIKQYNRALDICIQHNVLIEEDLVKHIIPDEPNDMNKNQKHDLLKTLAEKCRKQGSFELAHKLYFRLGDKIKSLKCLIELGDSDKVMLFANNARNTQTWILAANFLQNADWHKNPQLMKTIIQFYSKAKAYQNLSSFFEACSNLEIDEYRDYDKASAAIKQALKHMSKSNSADRENRIASLTKKKALVDKFIDIKNLCQQDPNRMVKQCRQLLEEPDIQASVRRGDIYAILIEYYYEMKQYEKCNESLKQMKQKGIIITPYIDKEIINNTYKALGISNKRNLAEEQIMEEIN